MFFKLLPFCLYDKTMMALRDPQPYFQLGPLWFLVLTKMVCKKTCQRFLQLPINGKLTSFLPWMVSMIDPLVVNYVKMFWVL